VDVSGYVAIESEPAIWEQWSIEYEVLAFALFGPDFTFYGTDGDFLILSWCRPEWVDCHSASPEWWHLYGEGTISTGYGLFESPNFFNWDGTPVPYTWEEYTHLAPVIEIHGWYEGHPNIGQLWLTQVPEPPTVLLLSAALTAVFGRKLLGKVHLRSTRARLP
jgi:hypothetical protein